jgi:hypothetical protein
MLGFPGTTLLSANLSFERGAFDAMGGMVGNERLLTAAKRENH